MLLIRESDTRWSGANNAEDHDPLCSLSVRGPELKKKNRQALPLQLHMRDYPAHEDRRKELEECEEAKGKGPH